MNYPEELSDSVDFRSRSNTWPRRQVLEGVESVPVLPGITEEQHDTHLKHRNGWGNLSYAEIITKAIQSSPRQRLTLAEIYEWMIANIPYFRQKSDKEGSASWKNSVRHNLSLHTHKFIKVDNENARKSSWWMLNPDKNAKKHVRKRSSSVRESSRPNIRAIREKYQRMKLQNRLATIPSMVDVNNCGNTTNIVSNQWYEPQNYNDQLHSQPHNQINDNGLPLQFSYNSHQFHQNVNEGMLEPIYCESVQQAISNMVQETPYSFNTNNCTGIPTQNNYSQNSCMMQNTPNNYHPSTAAEMNFNNYNTCIPNMVHHTPTRKVIIETAITNVSPCVEPDTTTDIVGQTNPLTKTESLENFMYDLKDFVEKEYPEVATTKLSPEPNPQSVYQFEV